MPCDSRYLDQTEREKELQRAAKLLVYVRGKIGKPIDELLSQTAAAYYASVDYVPELCGELCSLSKTQVDEIVYNARDKNSRDLADWWERHESADRQREADEQAKVKKNQLINRAINKLTREELDALGIRNLSP